MGIDIRWNLLNVARGEGVAGEITSIAAGIVIVSGTLCGLDCMTGVNRFS